MEVWTPVVLDAYFAKTVAANFFLDLSEEGKNGGDIFNMGDVKIWQIAGTSLEPSCSSVWTEKVDGLDNQQVKSFTI